MAYDSTIAHDTQVLDGGENVSPSHQNTHVEKLKITSPKDATKSSSQTSQSISVLPGYNKNNSEAGNISPIISHIGLQRIQSPQSLFTPNCYILMSNHAFDFKPKSTRNHGVNVDKVPEGYIFEKKEQAEAVAAKFTKGKREVKVRPWYNSFADKLWHSTKEDRKETLDKIFLELDKNRNDLQKQKLEDNCLAEGLHHSFLYCDAIPDDMSEKEKKIFAHYKPRWDALREKKENIDLRQHDINIAEKEDLIGKHDDFLAEFNKKHAVVHTSKTYILTEKHDPVLNRPTFTLEPTASFHAWYKPRRGGKDDKEQLSNLWLSNPDRRQYPGGIIFDPSTPGHYGEYYNLFQGFRVKPEEGDCSLFWQLVKEALAAGREEIYIYIRKWLAHMIQRPWELPEVALAFRSGEGKGKGTFMRYVGKLVSPHYIELSQMSQVVGNFNSHLKDVILAYANEAIWGGHKADIGTLKTLITDPMQIIEQKGVDSLTVRNCKRLILSSNEDWIAPIGIDDRRFLVVDVAARFKEKELFFKELEMQMDNGGLQALMCDLLNEDIKDWHPRRKPRSFDGFDLKLKSMKTPHRWLYECLSNAKITYNPTLADPEWTGSYVARKSGLYMDYKAFCEETKRTPDYDGLFWKSIKSILGDLTETRPRENRIQIPKIAIPSLKAARESFADYTKENMTDLWPEIGEV